MDHDRKTCPRCGEPTSSYGFCTTCRAHIDALTGAATSAQDLTTAQVLREVVRLEQALADASQGTSDRMGGGSSTAAVEVDSRQEIGSDEADHGGLEIAKLPTGADRGSDPPRDVARLEDVLTISSRPEAREADDEEDTPVAEVEPPSPAQQPLVESVPPPAAARLEDVLSVVLPSDDYGIAPRTAAAAAPEVEKRTPPSYVAAHMLRAAFWFEQTSAFESRPDDEALPETVEPPLPELDPTWDPSTSTPPPTSPTPSEPPEPLPAAAQAESSRSTWLAALCLLALITLVAVLTGRRSCRCAGQKTR